MVGRESGGSGLDQLAELPGNQNAALDAPVGSSIGTDRGGAIAQMKGHQPHRLLAGGLAALVHRSGKQHPENAGHLLRIGDRTKLGRAVGTAVDADPADLALQVQQIPTDPCPRIGVSLKEDQPAILAGR